MFKHSFKVRRVLLLTALCCICISPLFFHCSGERGSLKLLQLHGRTMGTYYNVKVVIDDGSSLNLEEVHRALTVDLENILDKVNQQMSTWLMDSEISRFNRYTETDWFEVSTDTAMVISEALRISHLSGGAFDITVAPLINLWGFGPSRTERTIPDIGRIKAVKSRCGFSKLSFRQLPPALKKNIPRLNCNLAAIAKGFGVDKVARHLEEKKYKHYMVEIGGEVRVRGRNDKNRTWKIGIARPDTSSALQKAVLLKDASMATSGDYRNYFEKEGVRYSHTIDPTTGMPITHTLASVTVIHASCMTADAFATAINVMGPGKGYDLAVKENLAVFMIIREKDRFVEKMSPRFRKLLEGEE